MSRTLQARRTIELVALVTAALMVLTVALAASDAEAKKKKKRLQFNVVQCEAPTENYEPICEGTEGNDFMVVPPPNSPTDSMAVKEPTCTTAGAVATPQKTA